MMVAFSPSLMTNRTKLITAITLLVVMAGMSAAEYYTEGDVYVAQIMEQESSSSSVSASSEPAGGGVAKYQGPDIRAISESQGFTVSTSNDETLLQQVAPQGLTIASSTILLNGDRAGSVAWVGSPDVKNIFITLKDALITAFSPQMTDLRDETVQQPGFPVRNILTFLDPTLSEERLVFVRSRERLYEFHIAENAQDRMKQLIEAITTQ